MLFLGKNMWTLAKCQEKGPIRKGKDLETGPIGEQTPADPSTGIGHRAHAEGHGQEEVILDESLPEGLKGKDQNEWTDGRWLG